MSSFGEGSTNRPAPGAPGGVPGTVRHQRNRPAGDDGGEQVLATDGPMEKSQRHGGPY
jgi:hypothetical protein